MRKRLEPFKSTHIPWGRICLAILLLVLFLLCFTGMFSGIGKRSNAGEPARAQAMDFYDLSMLQVEAIKDAEVSEAANPGIEAGLIPGDILVGRCRLSLVPSLDPLEGWTHVALYIGDGRIMVASNPRSGVREYSLSTWMYPSMTWVAYMRVSSADEETRAKAVEFAVAKEGQPYDSNWFSKQEYGESWYCSELIWAAYLHASGGRINLERGLGLFGVSPDDIYMNENVVRVGGHFEKKPDTILSLLAKAFMLCALAGGFGILLPQSLFSRLHRH